MNKDIINSCNKLLNGGQCKDDIKKLQELADKEIKEWQDFKKVLNKKYEN